MHEILARLADFARLIDLEALVKSLGYALVVYAGFFGLVFFLERRAGEDVSRYRSRHFLNDVVYTLFYRGGFYNVLVLAALTNALDRALGVRPNLLGSIPWWAGLAIFWVGGDFAMYWWHRLQHSNRFLWALHSVHHSQERMTLLTAARRHPIEMLSLNIIIFYGIFHWVLGVPTQGWLPLAAAITSILAIQHSMLDWTLGPFYRVIVGPRFHSYHHSIDPRHANGNYGHLFSAWDYLFGTAVQDEKRPERFGVEGLGVDETIRGQLVRPLRLIWEWRRRPAPAPVAAPAPLQVTTTTETS